MQFYGAPAQQSYTERDTDIGIPSVRVSVCLLPAGIELKRQNRSGTYAS